MDPKRIVAQGYDQIAERYAAWTGSATGEPRERYVDLLEQLLPSGSRVLDLGCGTGALATTRLARRFAVTGVDLSGRSIALARRNLPEATFLHADMTALDLPVGAFDAVVAFYSNIHVPRAEHALLLRSVTRLLRPGGVLIATMGVGTAPGDIEEDWLGAPMFFSHYDADTNKRLIEAAGLRLISARVEATEEDGVPIPFLWIVAERPLSPAATDARPP